MIRELIHQFSVEGPVLPAGSSGLTRRGIFSGVAIVIILASWHLAALGQQPAAPSETYPAKTIRCLVPFPPGSIPDRLSRMLGQRLQEIWGQPVVVENRPGAGGSIAAEMAAKAPPDGHTLFLGGPATHATNVAIFGSKLPYDPVKDFAPVSLLATVPSLLLVHPSVPANNVQELIALAKSKPGAINYTSAGLSSSGHIAGSLFKELAGIDIVHIPNRGPVQALQDLVGGQVEILFDTAVLAMPLVRAGKLRALAVTSRERMPVAPDVPTMGEAGVPDYEIVLWFAVFATAGTPAPIIGRLNAEAVRLFSAPEVRKRLAGDGIVVVASTPDALAAHVRSEIVKWGKLVRDTGARAE